MKYLKWDLLTTVDRTQATNISHLRKRNKYRFQIAFSGDILVPRRVHPNLYPNWNQPTSSMTSYVFEHVWTNPSKQKCASVKIGSSPHKSGFKTTTRWCSFPASGAICCSTSSQLPGSRRFGVGATGPKGARVFRLRRGGRDFGGRAKSGHWPACIEEWWQYDGRMVHDGWWKVDDVEE